jgi:hypothetical protein
MGGGRHGRRGQGRTKVDRELSSVYLAMAGPLFNPYVIRWRFRMEKSALSGQILEAGNKTQITVILEDGRRRKLPVTAAEAEKIAAEGSDASSIMERLVRSFSKPMAWLMALIIASILVPAVTRQWADRPKELDFKNSLIKDLSDSTASTIDTARFIVANTLPESKVTFLACKDAVKTKTPESTKACNAQKLEEAKAEQRAYNEMKDSWIRRGAILNSELRAYYSDDSSISTEGQDYIDAVTKYVRMASTLCDPNDARYVISYLDAKRDARLLPLISQLKSDECEAKPSKYVNGYSTMGDQLLERRKQLAEPLLTTHAQGYDTSSRDLLADIWPYLLFVVVMVLIYGVVDYRSIRP